MDFLSWLTLVDIGYSIGLSSQKYLRIYRFELGVIVRVATRNISACMCMSLKADAAIIASFRVDRV